jgi:hypothetical protein
MQMTAVSKLQFLVFGPLFKPAKVFGLVITNSHQLIVITRLLARDMLKKYITDKKSNEIKYEKIKIKNK